MFRVGGVAAMGVCLAGCYTLEPARVQPVPGNELALDVNDAGRVALGGAMGPEISQVEGRLVEKTTADYLVAVSVVRLLRGGEQTWRGEQVRIKSEYVSTVYERRFSKSRTVALGVVGVAAAAYLASRGLKSAPSGEIPIIPLDTGITQRRPRP